MTSSSVFPPWSNPFSREPKISNFVVASYVKGKDVYIIFFNILQVKMISSSKVLVDYVKKLNSYFNYLSNH